MTFTTIQEHPYNLITLPTGEKFLKTAAIYGANASGKSALLDAFQFMRRFVLSSFTKENMGNGIPIKGIPINRFVLDKTAKTGKSEFEVFFRYKEKEYQYGFVVDNKKVHEEWLYKRDFRGKTKYNTLFERKDEKIRCTKHLKGAEKFVEHVEEATLFLSMISNLKINDAKIVFDWFLTTIIIDFSHSSIEDFITECMTKIALTHENYQSIIEEFLKAIDTGIEGIRVTKIQDPSDSDGENIKYRIYSKHKTLDDGGIIEIPFTEESSGTQKMYCLFFFLYMAIKNGNTLFVDELDAKLHPILLRYIINMFHSTDINKNNSQLIYTTHDPYTLTREIFRRDQIWFAEKDSNGISKLYSLAEFKLDGDKKVRNDASYNKDYLSGRYGAIPILKEFQLWED